MELEGVLRGGLDDQGAGAQDAVEQAVPELDAVDAGQRDVDAGSGDQAVAEHDTAIGDHEAGGPPIEEGPHREPADEDEPDGGDDEEDDVLSVRFPGQGVDVAGEERGGGGRDDEQQRRNEEAPPMRVAMQDDVFVLCQHVLGVSHAGTVLSFGGSRGPISVAPPTASFECQQNPTQEILSICQQTLPSGVS